MSADFEYAMSQLQESYRGGLKAFADWCEKTWVFEIGKEKWPHGDEYPGDEYVKAYNAGIESIQGALNCFLDDMWG